MVRLITASLMIALCAPAHADKLRYEYASAVEVRADRMEPIRKADLEKLLARDEAKIRACYESPAKANPDLEYSGSFGLDRFYDDGMISSDAIVERRGRFVDAAVPFCIRKLMSAWKVKGSGRAVFAFEFKAVGAPTVKGPLPVEVVISAAQPWGNNRVDRRWLRGVDDRLNARAEWARCKRFAGSDSEYRGTATVRMQVDAYGNSMTRLSWSGIRPKKYAMIECLEKTAKRLTVRMPVTEGGKGYSVVKQVHFSRAVPGRRRLRNGPVGEGQSGTIAAANVCSTLTAKIGRRRDASRYVGRACARLTGCLPKCDHALELFTSLYGGNSMYDKCEPFRAAHPALDTSDRKATNAAAAAYINKALAREIARVERGAKRCRTKACSAARNKLATACKPYR